MDGLFIKQVCPGERVPVAGARRKLSEERRESGAGVSRVSGYKVYRGIKNGAAIWQPHWINWFTRLNERVDLVRYRACSHDGYRSVRCR